MSQTWTLLHKSNTEHGQDIAELHRQDADRFQNFSSSHEGLLLDYSLTRIHSKSLALLQQLADESGIAERRAALLSGEPVNETESRPAWHSALRGDSQEMDPKLAQDIAGERDRFLARADLLASGRLPGAETRIHDVIHLGIGGSMLGPALVAEALDPPGKADDARPNIHFLASSDGHALERTLQGLDPEQTALIIASKSFSTQETLLNAQSVMRWMAGGDAPGAAVLERVMAITSRPERAAALGIHEDNSFRIWPWVGGRYSLWSAMGLPAAIRIGSEGFRQLLSGAADMDRHFARAEGTANLPLMAALVSVWHRNVLGAGSVAVVPYDQRLRLLPDWLQQLEMESNGKSIGRDGQPIRQATAPVVLGGTGTVAQHSLFQAIHQGTDLVPVEFIGVLRPDHQHPEHHRVQLAHLLAQSRALAFGRDAEATRKLPELQAMDEAQREQLLPSRLFHGNRGSTTLMLDRLGPYELGQLLAYYEQRVFAESVIWNINAFDQWGVELGKTVAGDIWQQLGAGQQEGQGSEASLVDWVQRRWREPGN